MNSRCNFFVTGTDTGVGKTVVTAALLAALRSMGRDAVAMKPVQTGSQRDRSADLDFCARAAKWKIPADEYDELCPYRFRLPASPHLAAHAEGQMILPKRILASFLRLRALHDSVLVEGAGGVLVPLRKDYDQRDLMVALKLPVIVVARAGLGTLNHTLLTVEALRIKKIVVAAVVLSNPSAEGGVIVDDNKMFLSQTLAPTPVVALGPIRAGSFVRAGKRLLRELLAK